MKLASSQGSNVFRACRAHPAVFFGVLGTILAGTAVVSRSLPKEYGVTALVRIPNESVLMRDDSDRSLEVHPREPAILDRDEVTQLLLFKFGRHVVPHGEPYLEAAAPVRIGESLVRIATYGRSWDAAKSGLMQVVSFLNARYKDRLDLLLELQKQAIGEMEDERRRIETQSSFLRRARFASKDPLVQMLWQTQLDLLESERLAKQRQLDRLRTKLEVAVLLQFEVLSEHRMGSAPVRPRAGLAMALASILGVLLAVMACVGIADYRSGRR